MGWIIVIVVVFFIIKAIASNNTTTNKNIVTTTQTTTVKEPPKPALQYPTTEKKVTPVVPPVVAGASIKCPVCKTDLPSGSAKCPCCDFAELQREFINAEDAASWFENVVVPHRLKWEQAKNEPAFFTADELYAQMAAKQNKGISSHIDESAGEFEYIAYKDGIELTRYNGNASSVNVPEKIDGKQVLRLGNSLFENCKWLTTVTLPNGLTSIGNKTFRSTTLTHIVFPNSIEEIGEEAFAYSSVTEMVFPPSIKVIPKQVCYTCKKLKTVIIMGAVEIKESAFCFCEAITKLALPDTLITMKDGALACCHALEEVVLPASLQSIYGDFHCSSRGRIVVLNDDMIWKPASKSLTFVNGVTIYCNPGSTSQQHARDWGMKMKLLSEYQH